MAGPRIWRLAAAAALAGAGAGPAEAQISSSVELGGAKLSVRPSEIRALTELGAALGRPKGVQDSLLAEARREARSPDARHWLALLELEIGRRRRDDSMRGPALDRLIASELTPRDKLAGLLEERGGVALRAGDLALARTLWTRLLTLRPDDPDVLANLAQVRVAEGDPTAAAELLDRSVEQREKAGGKASAASYRQRLTIVQSSGPPATAAAAGRALVAAYPTPDHWREALVVYRQLLAPTGGLEIDLLLLMRAAGVLRRGDEYLRLAQLLRQAGQAADAKAVMDEGRARGLFDPASSPAREIGVEIERALPQERARLATAPSAESLAGAGRYAEAEARYRSALAAGGGDPGEANTRLGMVLVRAGRRAEAEAAFRAAAQSPRYGEIARFWLLWLAQPPRA